MSLFESVPRQGISNFEFNVAVDVAVVALPNVATARCLPFAASSLASTEDQWCFNEAIGAIMMKSRLTLIR